MNEKAYVESFRSHTRSGELRVSGRKKADAEAEGMALGAEAQTRLEHEYQAFKLVMEAFGNDTSVLDAETEETFFTEYAKRVYLFSILSERAERKGLLPTRIGALSDEEKEAVYDELSGEYRKIIGELGEGHVTKQMFNRNPVLFQSSEVYAGLKKDYPDLTPSVLLEFAVLNQSDPRAACERFQANLIKLSSYTNYMDGAEVSPSIHSFIARRYPTKPQESMEELDLLYSGLREDFDDIPRYIVLTICLESLGTPDVARNKLIKFQENFEILINEYSADFPKYVLQIAASDADPKAWLGSYQERKNAISGQYPELFDSIASRLAATHTLSSLERAEQIVNSAYTIMDKFGLNFSSGLQISFRNTEAEEAASEITSKVNEALAANLGFSRKQLVELAISSGPDGLAEKITNLQEIIQTAAERYPDLPVGFIRTLAVASSKESALDIIDGSVVKLKQLSGEFPEMTRNEIIQFLKRYSNEEPYEGLYQKVEKYREAVRRLVANGVGIDTAKKVCYRSPGAPEEALEKIYAAQEAINALFPDMRESVQRRIATNFTGRAVAMATAWYDCVAQMLSQLPGANEKTVQYVASLYPTNPSVAIEQYKTHYPGKTYRELVEALELEDSL